MNLYFQTICPSHVSSTIYPVYILLQINTMQMTISESGTPN